MVAACAAISTLAGCSGTRIVAGTVPAAAPTELSDPYPEDLIGPSDVLSVVVFKEPELTFGSLIVDGGGRFQIPLIGTVVAAGKTTEQLQRELTGLFGRYLVDPNVSVNLVSSGSRKFVVEGAVENPGVFPLERDTSLLSAVATARGTKRIAKINQVAIFRKVMGGRQVAVFDLGAIREGRLADPVLQPGDVVVVGFSGMSQAWQDFLSTAPVLALFMRF